MKNLTVRDVKVIGDQDRLLEIIMNRDLDFRIRHAAVENLEDKSFFKDCAYDEDEFLRIFAAQYIDDDETLLDLALNDSNDYVRHKAGANFVDNCDSERYGDVLLEFALENPKYNVSPFSGTDGVARFACHRIDDTSKLLRIIRESESRLVYMYAIRKVDEDALFGLWESGDLDGEKAMAVAKRFDDDEKLRKLLHSGKLDYKNRIRVAAKLEDDEMLKELLEVPVGPSVPEGKVFPDLFPADDIYKSIVFSYPNEEIAIMALKNIGHKANLEYVADNHGNPEIRRLAAEKLKGV